MELINRFAKLITIITFSAMFIIIAFQILTRSVFNFSFFWTDELSRFLFICASLIGATVAYRNNEFIAIDRLENLLVGNSLRILKFIIELLTFIFFLIVSFYAIQYIFSDRVFSQVSPSLQVPMFIPYSLILVNSLLLNVYSAIKMIKLLRPK